jgi:hypothetical protein
MSAPISCRDNIWCALRRRLGGRNLNAMVVGFQYLADPHRFLAEVKQRLEAFALELHPDKTGSSSLGTSLIHIYDQGIEGFVRTS